MPAPLTFLSPGVKVREIDFSAYNRGPGSTVFGLLGIFEKGPVATPTLVQSLPEAQRIFGNYLSTYMGMHALKQFFDNGGQQALVCRTAHYTSISDASTLTAVKATRTLNDRAGSPLPTLKVDAISEGAWGNGATGGLSVAILDGTVNPSTEFRLEVYLNAVLIEVYDNMLIGTANAGNADYVERRINGVSEYITVTDLASATAAPNNRPALLAQGSGSLASGNDGLTSLGDTDFTGNQAAKTGIYAFDGTELVDIIGVPGQTSRTVQQALLDYATARKNVYAILEPPQSLTLAGVIAFRNATTPYTGTPFDSSYGGLYYPWLKYLDPLTNTPRFYPPTGSIAGLVAASDALVRPWGAAAGFNRGVLKQVLGLETDIMQPQADQLFPFDVNPIVRKEGIGFVVFGQNTLQRKDSATDRMNVRRLLIFVERALTTFAESLLFEPHTKQTRDAFKRFAEPFLTTIKDQQGIYDFWVVCDETNNPPAVIDQNRLNIDVFIKPTKTAEFITLNIMVTTTGADFKEIFAQG